MKLSEINKLQVLCPAKINLGLKVGKKRSDGYHEIETIFQSVDLYDELTVSISFGEVDQLTVSGPIPLTITKDNLIFRALNLFRSLTGIHQYYTVELIKRIPIGAGLGGGSSDAAGALIAANFLINKPLNSLECLKALSQIGSDCAFFYHGGLQYATGRGEILTNVPKLLTEVFIIWCPPDFSSNTKDAYDLLNRDLTYPLQDFILVHYFLRKEPWWNFPVINDFEQVISPKIQNWNVVKDYFVGADAKWISMSGSGSAMIACFETYDSALTAFQNAPFQKQCFLVKPVQGGIVLH